jgi:hypothetical protein
MRGEDFSAWLAAIGGMSAEQRRRGLQALMKATEGLAVRKKEPGPAKAARAAGGRTRLEWRASSGWKAMAAPIARAARSSAGAARTGCCGSAARVADARSTLSVNGPYQQVTL